jgi:aspartyl-tRNA(Asn)/glutamyl-tRNA(Gln) amidotransferase subunit C
MEVARLARLKLSPEQLEMYTEELSRILEYIEKLNEVDTSEVELHVSDLLPRKGFREDEVTPSLSVESALANAPDREDGYFRVPRVIG